MKLAILTSHPIQYQSPLFRLLAQQPEIDLTVYFNWNFGLEEKEDPEFGKKFKWDIPLLEGYKYKFLKNFSLKPSSEFWGQINPGIVKELIWGTSDVQKLKYDAILVFGWNSFTHWLAFLSAFALKIPALLRAENPLNQELLKPKWKTKIKKIILGKILFPRVSAFLYIGEENKKFYQFYGVPEEKLFFVPYAVDNERFQKAAQELKPKRDELRQELGIKKDDVVILFVGKLIEKKRPMDLLKAYEMLASGKWQMANSSHLIFVGSGELEEQLKQYAKGQMQLTEKHSPNSHSFVDSHYAVHFVGFKNQTELPECYTMADIFVLPSGMGETWGLVVNEAMNFGLPIIVSDVVGCGPDLVKEGENGYRFVIGNTNMLSSYLGKLIKNIDERKNLGKKSLEIINRYNYKKDIQGLLRALNQII